MDRILNEFFYDDGFIKKYSEFIGIIVVLSNCDKSLLLLFTSVHSPIWGDFVKYVECFRYISLSRNRK